MINLTDGKIKIGDASISPGSSIGELKRLSNDGLIEERETCGARRYYYAEAVEGELRFSVFIRLREEGIEWILLRWVDRPMKSWDDVSEAGLKDEYHRLLTFVERQIGRPPDKKRNRERTWHTKWGRVDVSYEPDSFEAAVFMMPRQA